LAADPGAGLVGDQPAAILAIQVVFWLGYGLVLLSTSCSTTSSCLACAKVWARLRGRELPAPQFARRSSNKRTRHPLYLGFLLAFWAAPPDGRSSAVRRGDERIYPDRHLARGARPDRPVRPINIVAYREQVSMLIPAGRRPSQSPRSGIRGRPSRHRSSIVWRI